MNKIRPIIGGLQKDEVELLHYDVPDSECSEEGVDCVFVDEEGSCINCGEDKSLCEICLDDCSPYLHWEADVKDE